ncbi:MAG TPA: sulfatase, partial [Armatimonadota bacterium]
MRVTAIRKHIQPMVLGIAIGLIGGIFSAIPGLITTGCLKHRLYYSMTCMLLANINTCVLAACVTAYACYIGTRLKGWLSFLINFTAGFGFLVFVGMRFGLSGWVKKHVLGDLNLIFVMQFFIQGLPQILACVVVISVFTVLMRRSRRAASPEATVEEKLQAESGNVTAVTRNVKGLRFTGYLSALVFATFIGLNCLPVLLRVKNVREARKSPNIIYIVVDTLRADHLGCYGYTPNTSPNIDKFAAESMRFDKAIAQAPWTTESIASFMSSRYLQIGINALQPMPSDVTLMPELLKERGYVTGAVVSNPLAGMGARLARGYDHYYEMRSTEVKSIEDKHRIPRTVYSHSVKMLRQMKNQRFFLFAHFMGPHSPYASHKEYNFFPDYKGKLSREGVHIEQDVPVGDDLKYTVAMYDGEIAYTDRYIGLLLAELKRLNLYEDTLIVLLADHGEEFGEHGKMSHGIHLYDESISVPLIVKLPGQKEGKVVQGAFSLVNLLPTVTDYIHCDTSAMEFQGTAVPLKGLRKVRESNIYSRTDFGNRKRQSLRSETKKYIYDEIASTSELYDLTRDPGEKRDIAAKSRKTTSDFEVALQSTNARIEAALAKNVTKPL